MSFEGEVISDTHLNLWKYNKTDLEKILPARKPNLVLAGDIGDPDEVTLYNFLDIARSRYKRIIYVPGNHEFYARTPGSKKVPASVISWFNKLDTQWDNFHFFYRRAEVYDGVQILGATCWSSAPKNTTWSNLISEEGRKDQEFIEYGLANISKGRPTLVVTHYPPTLRVIIPEFKNTISQFNYAQDLEYIFRYPLHTWMFGHVHQAHDFTIPYSSSMAQATNVRLLCNPYGYPGDTITSPLPKQFTIPSLPPSVKSAHDRIYQIQSSYS
jgi:hypothetical protein